MSLLDGSFTEGSTLPLTSKMMIEAMVKAIDEQISYAMSVPKKFFEQVGKDTTTATKIKYEMTLEVAKPKDQYLITTINNDVPLVWNMNYEEVITMVESDGYWYYDMNGKCYRKVFTNL